MGLSIDDLSRMSDAVVQTTAVGEVRIKRLVGRDMIKLESANRASAFTPKSFVDHLLKIAAVDPEGRLLTRAQLDRLSSEDRAALLNGLLQQTDGWFRGSGSDDASADAEPRTEVQRLVKSEKESAEEFIFRGWRTWTENLGKSVRIRLKGLGIGATDAIAPGLAANLDAYRRLGELARASGTPSINPHDSFETAKPPEAIRWPPNPIIETNHKLGEVSAHMAAMRELAMTTAEMQRGLNDVALNILGEFSKGAAESQKAGRIALLVAVIAAVASMISAVPTVSQWIVSHPVAPQMATSAQIERLISAERANATAMNQLMHNVASTSPTRIQVPKVRQGTHRPRG